MKVYQLTLTPISPSLSFSLTLRGVRGYRHGEGRRGRTSVAAARTSIDRDHRACHHDVYEPLDQPYAAQMPPTRSEASVTIE